MPLPTLTLQSIPTPWRDRFLSAGAWGEKQGVPTALVGGCVRDLMLDRSPRDWDIVVDAQAHSLAQTLLDQFGGTLVEHPRFLTRTLHFHDGTHLDIATAREEIYPTPGSLPQVRPSTVAKDYVRRDFTVNSFYLTLPHASLLDPAQGLPDLKAGLLRVLHDGSFTDDPTRLHRLARYAGRYGWTPDTHTRDLIHSATVANAPTTVSPVRLRHELFHILQEPNPVPALRSLWDWGLWPYWDPTWIWSDSRSDLLAKPVADDVLPTRLILFFDHNLSKADAWLKKVSCPVSLRHAVANRFLSQNPGLK